jgi:hypothetical protein
LSFSLGSTSAMVKAEALLAEFLKEDNMNLQSGDEKYSYCCLNH